MGRQAYLTRLALGRSAFEVQDQDSLQALRNVHTQTIEPGLETSEHPTTTRNDYEQRYDERGHPINPASREHGRMLREAQNDVLAAIGVVERRFAPISEDDVKSLLKKIDVLDRMESENNVGDIIASVSTLAQGLCTWWIGSLRDRILTFRIPSDMHFTTLIYTQYQSVGFWAFFWAGLPAYILGSIGVHAVISLGGSLRLLDRLLLWTRLQAGWDERPQPAGRMWRPSRRTKRLIRRWKPAIAEIFHMFAKVAFYPMFYHAGLQRLHLLPLRPFLPPLEAFVPFTTSSPIQKISIPSTFTQRSVKTFAVSLLASPLLMFFIEAAVETQVCSVIYAAVSSRRTEGSTSEVAQSEVASKPRAANSTNLRESTWGLFGNAFDTFVRYLQRAYIFHDEIDGRRTPQERYIEGQLDRMRAEIEIGNLRITNLTRLDVPLAHAEDASRPMAEASHAGHAAMPLDPSRPVSPVSHTISEGSQNAMDPSVRITSREDNDGIVELEVRLPQVMSVTHDELAAHDAATRAGDGTESEDDQQWVFFRATKLSTEPGRMLKAILNDHITTWARMPLQLTRLRLMAWNFYAANPQADVALHGRRYAQQPLLARGAVRGIGRVLLCGGTEFILDLALWGVECACIIAWFGARSR